MKISSDLFTYPFRAPGWQRKALIGGALVLAPLTVIGFPLVFMLLGYQLRALRATIQQGEPALPDWSDPWRLLVDGFKLWLVSIIYGLPMLALMVFVWGVMAGGMIGMAASPLAGNEEALGATMGLMYLCFFPLIGLIYPISFAIIFLQMVGITRIAVEGRFSAGLEIGEVWRMAKTNWKQYLVAFIVWYALLFGLSMLVSFTIYTVVLICIYPFLLAAVSWYSVVLSAALYGLAYRETQVMGDNAQGAAGQ